MGTNTNYENAHESMYVFTKDNIHFSAATSHMVNIVRKLKKRFPVELDSFVPERINSQNFSDFVSAVNGLGYKIYKLTEKR